LLALSAGQLLLPLLLLLVLGAGAGASDAAVGSHRVVKPLATRW
jgi:hypothetical protein